MSVELVSLEAIQEIAQEYGYGAVFLGIMLENAGIPLPGETIILVGGFLAGNGDLDYWLVLGSTITGAVIGDSFGYWIGAWGGWSLVTRLGKFFRIEEEQLIKVKHQFSKNAAKAVFLGRFITLLRIFAGPLAGIAQMPYGKFLLYNAAGATLWASVIVTLAYFAGQMVTIQELMGWVSQLGLLGLLLVVAIVGATILWENRHRFFKQVEPQE